MGDFCSSQTAAIANLLRDRTAAGAFVGRESWGENRSRFDARYPHLTIFVAFSNGPITSHLRKVSAARSRRTLSIVRSSNPHSRRSAPISARPDRDEPAENAISP